MTTSETLWNNLVASGERKDQSLVRIKPYMEGLSMSEKDLVDLWNNKRSQLSKSQFQSVVALAVIAALAFLGNVESATQEVKIFGLVFLVSVGALNVLTQLAVIREAQSVVIELSAIAKPGAVAATIAKSGRYLLLTGLLLVALSAATLGSFIMLVM